MGGLLLCCLQSLDEQLAEVPAAVASETPYGGDSWHLATTDELMALKSNSDADVAAAAKKEIRKRQVAAAHANAKAKKAAKNG